MTRFGGYTLYALETGRFRLDGGAMFGIIPRPLWERRFAPDDRNRIEMAMRCLLIEGGGRLILVDAGLGQKYDAKFADIYGVDHSGHTLDASLEASGFSAGDVTDVILTHLHFDHCGGVTERRGEELVVTFPSARIHVQKRHWEWAHRPNARERASFLRENLEPIAASGQLSLIDGARTLFPGIHLHLAEGHTEAQQLVRIESDGKSLLYAADVIPTHAHLPEVWVMSYDVRPLVSMEEKKRLLEQAYEGRWSLFFEHDPAIEIADLRQGPKGYELDAARPLREL